MAREKIAEGISYDIDRKLYYVAFTYGRDGNGKFIRKYKTYSTLKEARAAKREFDANKDHGDTLSPRRITLGDVMQEWLKTVAQPKIAHTTYYGYEQIVRNHLLKDKIGKLPIQDIKARDIQQYYARALEKLSPNTVIKHYNLLSSIFDYAVMMKYAYRNYVKETMPPKKIVSEPDIYTAEQLQTLFRAVQGTWMEPVVFIAGYLGLRREEISGLRWSSIDFTNNTILICDARTSAGSTIIEKETKTSSSYRKLQMPSTLREVLLGERQRQEEWKGIYGAQYHNGGYVIQHDDGRPRRPNYLSAKLQQIVSKYNLPHITLHGLRHTFASLANQSGVTLFDTSKALGHSSPDITGRIYTHLLTNVQSTSVAGVSQQLDNRKKGAQ